MEIKIPFYNILNMFLTGLIFIGCCLLLFPQYLPSLISSSAINNLKSGFEIIVVVSIFAVAYEIGLIINRFGSIAIEPLMKKVKLIRFIDNYPLFNHATVTYPILNTLSREYALSRTSISLFTVLALISFVVHRWTVAVLFLFIATIFYFSCAKHAKKITALMMAQLDNN